MPNLCRTTVRLVRNPAWKSVNGLAVAGNNGDGLPSENSMSGAAFARFRDALRISMFLLTGPAPPLPPELWQATQDVSLYTGPSPSPPWLRGSFGNHSRLKIS